MQQQVVAAPIVISGQTVVPSYSNWNYKLPFGIYKNKKSDATALAQTVTVNTEQAVLEGAPQQAELVVVKSGSIVFNGTVADFANFIFNENGTYTCKLTVKAAKGESELGYGEVVYEFTIEAALPVRVALSTTTPLQGSIVKIKIYNAPAEAQISASTPLSDTVPFLGDAGAQIALVPVSYNRAVGDYALNIKVGEQAFDYTITVVEKAFMEERFDVPESVTSATVDSAAANEEFRRLVHPLYKTFDEQQYWSGLFVMPCDGRITSEFGLKRYINNAKTPSRHAGIDIANAKGTVVCAPNGGKVVFAQLLQLSGNTVVIEHGLGLKSYFFHMDSLAVKQGQMVEKGDKVGEIGTTGFSTGPHLHYQLMMFGASVNPWEAFDGTSGIYN